MGDPASQFLEELDDLLQMCLRHYQEGFFEQNFYESAHRRLQHFVSVTAQLAYGLQSETLASFERDVRQWLVWLDLQPITRSICCSTPTALPVRKLSTGEVGRPSYDIPRSVLEYLRDANFSWTQISKMFGISRRTITRRVNDFQLQRSATLTDISDADLRNLVSEIRQNHIHAGCRMVWGILRSRDVCVSLQRVHETLTEVDPLLSSQRWGAIVHRRTYHVKGANSLWHIDGHHSLIRWGLVIHAGIDGFSRLVVYLDCNSNNSADIAFLSFQKGVQQYGIPSRVRGDKGGENRNIAAFMIQNQGLNRGSFIAGSSTHNQRIERLWRDVFRIVLQTYYSFFYWLEDNNHLDAENDLHIFALQYVFKPRINVSLSEFAAGWNLHPMRTERNWTPYQMFVNSRMAQGADIHDETQNLAEYGRDWYGPVAQENESVIEVSEVRNPLSDAGLHILQEQLPDPTSACDDFGFSFFVLCRDFVLSHLDEAHEH